MTPQTILLIAITFTGAATDMWRGKVYNWMTYPAALAGIALSFVTPAPGPWQSLAGLGGALVLFGILRKIGRMGAGDVKLMAAVGALKGLPFVIFASFYVIVVAGLAAIVLLAMNRRLVPTLRWAGSLALASLVPGRTPRPLEGGQTDMPLAPAIFLGTLWCLYLEAINGPFSF
jgi:prepilin peptidase CpaA